MLTLCFLVCFFFPELEWGCLKNAAANFCARYPKESWKLDLRRCCSSRVGAQGVLGCCGASPGLPRAPSQSDPPGSVPPSPAAGGFSPKRKEIAARRAARAGVCSQRAFLKTKGEVWTWWETMGLISALWLWGNSSGSPGVVAVAGERSWALAEWFICFSFSCSQK